LIYELWIHPKGWLDMFVVQQTVGASKKMLELLGYEVFTSGNRSLSINNTCGVMMGDNCDGISLFSLFSAFIIAFPGPVIKKQFLFFRNHKYSVPECYPGSCFGHYGNIFPSVNGI